MSIFKFDEQIKVGLAGEQLFLAHYPHILSPCPDDRADFIIQELGELIELKTDTYSMEKTPNFFMEKYSDTGKKTLGGPWRAERDGVHRFIYLFQSDRVWFEFTDIPNLIKRLESLTSGRGYVNIKNRGWTTSGYKVKRDELADLYTIHKF